MAQERVDTLFASESWTAVYTAYSNVSLKAYDFDTIREALLIYIKETYPEKFNDFVSSSEFIAILDLVAYLGHSLAFRLDMNTRENFLDTAERRESVLRMAKTLGYNKSRPVNAQGFLKITSITTNQPIYDGEGNSLANRTLRWNDTNNLDWYSNFVTVLNSVLSPETKVNNPVASINRDGIETHLHYINEDPVSKAVRYSFSANVGGASRNFDVVGSITDGDTIIEREPGSKDAFTVVNRNDNLGPSSDRTGFFFLAKAGNLKYTDLNYDVKIPNRIQQVLENDISNNDVWLQRIDTDGKFINTVTLVDNNSRETAIFNSLRNGNGDIVNVTTAANNTIDLTFPDGVFGNAAYGRYRLWYRIADNASFSVNRGDIINKSITIPYLGADGKSYRATFTLSSTRDFTENYEGENYLSVKRVAPRNYYTQDRMVNGQDYNILPLTMGSGIVSKVKAFNTTFAGKSRHFEMDDVTGHHSNVSVIGDDGSVYVDDRLTRVVIPYQSNNGNIDDIIRNEFSKVLKHPSMVNKYYYTYKDTITTTFTNIDWLRVTSNPLRGYPEEQGAEGETWDGAANITDRDFLQIGGKWYKVVTVHSDGTFTLDSIPPAGVLLEKRIVGPTYVFLDEHVEIIKNTVLDETTITSFQIFYNYDITSDQGTWELYDAAYAIEFPSPELILDVTYKPGYRNINSEFIITFTGTDIILDSANNVKFYYSNGDIVIDNKTNLINRDKVSISYFGSSTSGSGATSETTTDVMNIGTGIIAMDGELAPSYDPGSNTIEFHVDFSYFDAPESYNFINDNVFITATQYHHKLISPIGDVIEFSHDQNAPIGYDPDWTIDGVLTNASSVISGTTAVAENENIDATLTTDPNTYTYSIGNIFIQGDPADIGDVGNVTDAYATLSSDSLATAGFKGSPSTSYFVEARDTGKFFFVDNSSLDPSVTLDTVVSTDIGVEKSYIISYEPGIDTYTFTFGANSVVAPYENDIYYKQFALGETVFFYAGGDLSYDNLVVKDDLDNVISNAHLELLTPTETGLENTYKIIYWTALVSVGDTISIFRGDLGITDLTGFMVNVTADTNIITPTEIRTNSYLSTSAYVYGKFVTNDGYIDNHKILLTSVNTDGDPMGTFNALENELLSSFIVLETYTDSNIVYEKISPRAIACAEHVDSVPGFIKPEYTTDTAVLWYNTTTGEWYRYISAAGIWTTDFVHDINSDGDLVVNYVIYRVVHGRSYYVDDLMTFKWDHYADKEKRIDPSTSNIIDVYVLTTDYVKNINTWISKNFLGNMPVPPNNYELTKLMSKITEKSAIGDHVSYIPAKFKFLFGSSALPENQAVFKVVKRVGTNFTDSEVKASVSAKVNEYFKLENWDFGDTFYYSELAAYLHKELGDRIASVVITPKYSTSTYSKMLSISSEPNEIFLSVTSSKDVQIIQSITETDLTGE